MTILVRLGADPGRVLLVFSSFHLSCSVRLLYIFYRVLSFLRLSRVSRIFLSAQITVSQSSPPRSTRIPAALS